jgi:Tol biopolymer transport system component
MKVKSVMMKNIATIMLLCFSLGFFNFLNAQTNEDWFYEAEDFLEDANFHKALNVYLDLVQHYPNNANINFKIGYCYINTATEKAKATPYLEFATKKISTEYTDGSWEEENAPIESLFYLGKAYQLNYRFEDAERVFIDLKTKLDQEQTSLLEQIDYELAACQVARVLVKNPVEMTVTNLGKQINTVFSEHSPIISGDESTLIFTSKREGTTGGRIMDDGQYFEDIFISHKKDGVYSKARKISKAINTDDHEASIGLSIDGQSLLIYKDDNGDGNIYRSNRGANGWETPEKLPSPINSKYKETHASFTVDQKTIYFTSDRKGGFGGLDIYRVTQLPNGKWSKAQNLGDKINTKYDEEGPYFHPDGVTLFFASQGHNTMGGFDIFLSTVNENGKWSKPENIGYPINTPDNDVFYMPSVDGRRAYYSSYTNNSIGNFDIFRIDLAESHVRNQTVIKGVARHTNGDFLENAIVTVFDSDDEVFGIYTPDPETKKFLIIVPQGKTFSVLIESTNYNDYECTIKVPHQAYDQSKATVFFNDIVVGGYKMEEAAGKESLTENFVQVKEEEQELIEREQQNEEIPKAEKQEVQTTGSKAESKEILALANVQEEDNDLSVEDGELIKESAAYSKEGASEALDVEKDKQHKAIEESPINTSAKKKIHAQKKKPNQDNKLRNILLGGGILIFLLILIRYFTRKKE